MRISFDDIIAKLSLEDYREILKSEWKDSEKTFPHGKLPFLRTEQIEKSAKLGNLDAETVKYLVEKAVPEIEKDSYLIRLIWHEYHLLYLSDRPLKSNAAKLPHLENLIGEFAYAFNLLLVLAGYTHAIKLHKKLGIPDDIAKDTYSDLAVWCSFYRESRKVTGLTTRILGWMQKHLSGKLFRVGRLQYVWSEFPGKIVVYRSRKTGLLQALAEDELNFNSAGQFDGVDGIYDKKGVWTSRLECGNSLVSGNPVSPLGFAEKRKITLNLSEWEKVMSHGDKVLDIHIPAIGPMTIELCADSINRASDFFTEYLSERHFKAFSCCSWFLDMQFEEFLSETSNVIRFQREFFLYPIPVGASESLWRIFGEGALKSHVKDYPRNTSMQKSAAAFLEEGGHLRAGGSFYLKDDLPFGRQLYRKAALA